MLQRFPVESKGRRKKLQEVVCYIHYLDGGVPTDFPISFLASTGWLCDHSMFRMLFGEMYNGESPCIP